jgi:hypothetical protein
MLNMKISYILLLATVLTMFFSCTEKTEEKNNVVEVPKSNSDSIIVKALTPKLKTDFPERVYAFRKMADSTTEQQVIKYETFAALFVEYAQIYKIHNQYSVEDQENNTEAYNIIRDEWVSLKLKLKKKMSLITRSYEKRLDAADARMNEYLPEVYKKK